MSRSAHQAEATSRIADRDERLHTSVEVYGTEPGTQEHPSLPVRAAGGTVPS